MIEKHWFHVRVARQNGHELRAAVASKTNDARGGTFLMCLGPDHVDE